MSKNLNKTEWLKIINIYKTEGIDAAEFEYLEITKQIYSSPRKALRNRIKNKAVLVDNNGMKTLNRKTGTGLSNKKRDDSDIPSIIDDLNDEQKREIIEHWIKEQRDKKDKKSLSGYKTLNISEKSRILKMHRTTFYKKEKQRTYKLDQYKKRIQEIYYSSKGIYGSRRIVEILRNMGIIVSDRTLRDSLKRWELQSLTRRARKKSESKNTNVRFVDLVQRNYNPEQDNIVATDVSYIPAKVNQNNLYLSVAISHKTKKVESWKLSDFNSDQLVVDTIKDLKRKNFILHSDHGSQYSSNAVQKELKKINGITSMSRIGNSLDNREVEYFFGCLKGEYLKHLNTRAMKFDEVYKHIEWYINWYNNERIQKVLQWKTPAFASVYN